MNIIATAQVILALLPVVSDTVKNVEAAVGAGNGAEKLKLALAIIKPIYEASNPPVAFDSVVAKITEVIAALVTFYGNIGAFVTSLKKAA
jgi:hypothetical protein